MPVKFEFTGKELVQNAHEDVRMQDLKIDYEKSLSDNPCLDDNLIIHGDNLQSLKSLLPKYAGKVKCIYIDPPYNTGNNFIYKDNANNTCIKDWLTNHPDIASKMDKHDKWLCMMYPRLKLLHELLADDGIIFISIDDNEQAHLKMLCDEIFGEFNSLTEAPSTFIWQRSGTTAGHLANSHEYIICYAKNKKGLPFFELSDYGENSIISHGALKKISKANPASEITFPAGMEFSGENSTFTGEIGGSEKQFIKDKMIFINGLLAFPVTIKAGWAMKQQIESWIAGKPTFDTKGQKVIRFFFNNEGILWYEKERKTFHPKTILDKSLITTKSGALEITDIFNKQVLDYPKPLSLIKYILSFSTKENDIILDSFAGSGTTAHAVLDLNKEDGGNRKFILIECEDYADTITAERVRRVIKGVPNAKDPKLKAGLGGSFTYCEL